jgi:hypothetical protein
MDCPKISWEPPEIPNDGVATLRDDSLTSMEGTVAPVGQWLAVVHRTSSGPHPTSF